MDYTGSTTTLQFSPAINSVTTSVAIFDDSVVEDPEYFTGNLAAVPGLVLVNPEQAFVTITDEVDRKLCS